MASIKNSLRKIYTALGGTTSNSKTIPGLLDDISTVASGGGDKDIFKVNFVRVGSGNDIVSDKTLKDICDAVDKDIPVFGFARIGMGGCGIFFLSAIYYRDNYYLTTLFNVTGQDIMLMEPVNNTADNVLWNTTKMTIN